MKKKTWFCRFYDKYLGWIAPKYGVFSVLFCVILNTLIYVGLHILMADSYHYDFTSFIEEAIPFVPEWSFVYLASFPFWFFSYLYLTRLGKDNWYKFATSDYMTRLVCGVFFVLMPTTNVRPEIVGHSLAENVMAFIYQVDPPSNLFPSFHCMVSWLCFIGFRNKKEVPAWVKWGSCILSLLIFASTLFTKQHYLIDVFAGVAVAELCCFLGKKPFLYKKVMRVFDFINTKIFGEGWNEE